MHANQKTNTHKSNNLNIRLSPGLRELVEVESSRRGKDMADIVREALEHYLPISSMLPERHDQTKS